jgi:hypothetical protein
MTFLEEKYIFFSFLSKKIGEFAKKVVSLQAE